MHLPPSPPHPQCSSRHALTPHLTRSPRGQVLYWTATQVSGPKIPFPNDPPPASRTCLASAQEPPRPPWRLCTKPGLERPPPEGRLARVGGAWMGRCGGGGGRGAGSMHTRPQAGQRHEPGWEEEGWFVAPICVLVPLLLLLSPQYKGPAWLYIPIVCSQPMIVLCVDMLLWTSSQLLMVSQDILDVSINLHDFLHDAVPNLSPFSPPDEILLLVIYQPVGIPAPVLVIAANPPYPPTLNPRQN